MDLKVFAKSFGVSIGISLLLIFILALLLANTSISENIMRSKCYFYF